LTIVKSLLSVALAVGLVVGWDLGTFGVALGFAASETLIGALLVTPYCCRAVGIPFTREIRRAVLPAVAATAPFAVALGAVAPRWSPDSLASLGVTVVVLGLTVLPGWWFWGFTATEKKRFARFVPGLRRFA
jgi:hypothetical protein